MSRAAAMYWSRCVGETRSTSATLSKPSLEISAGNIAGRIDVDGEQILHGGRILRSIQPVERHAARFGTALRGEMVEIGLERRDELVHFGALGPGTARRRHEIDAQLADDFFPDVRMRRHVRWLRAFQRQTARKLRIVVALRAVAIEDIPLPRDGRFGRGLRARGEQRSHEHNDSGPVGARRSDVRGSQSASLATTSRRRHS